MRETSLDYRHPYRPLPVRAINLLGRPLSAMNIQAKLSPESLMAAAEKRTGLSDYGDAPIKERLTILSRSLENEARLNFAGRFMVRETLLGMLTNRLRIVEDFKNHPEINDIEIQDPVIIAGLQRTGTTMLQRLLSSDTGTFRSLASWEAVNPAPRRDLKKKNGLDPRIGQAEIATRALKYLSPDFYASHPLEPTGSEEDCLLMNYTLLSVVPEATQRIPSFSQWLDDQDFNEAYEYHKKMLKYLSWQQGGTRWVLKTPDHMLHMKELFKVYPGARVIQTHRDPRETIASYCSMMSHAYGVFSDRIDPVEIGKHWSQKDARMMENMIDFRKKQPRSFIDVFYADLIRDPVKEIEKIYSFAGLKLTPQARDKMLHWKKNNPQHMYGKHRYNLESFEMTEKDVEGLFQSYYDVVDFKKRTFTD